MFKINFKEMKIRKKLVTAFTLVVILASISGVVSAGMILL